jgi:excisionase family DNA binding protein
MDTGAQNTVNTIQTEDRMLLRVEEAARLLSLGRAKAYLMAASGELPTVRVGRSVRIPAAALRAWVERQITDAR